MINQVIGFKQQLSIYRGVCIAPIVGWGYNPTDQVMNGVQPVRT